MADTPYPLTATNLEDLKQQIWNLIRPLYEDRILSNIDDDDVRASYGANDSAGVGYRGLRVPNSS